MSTHTTQAERCSTDLGRQMVSYACDCPVDSCGLNPKRVPAGKAMFNPLCYCEAGPSQAGPVALGKVSHR